MSTLIISSWSEYSAFKKAFNTAKAVFIDHDEIQHSIISTPFWCAEIMPSGKEEVVLNYKLPRIDINKISVVAEYFRHNPNQKVELYWDSSLKKYFLAYDKKYADIPIMTLYDHVPDNPDDGLFCVIELEENSVYYTMHLWLKNDGKQIKQSPYRYIS